MKKILNLTQHNATQEQKEQGVYDLNTEAQKMLKELLTFTKLPTAEEIHNRAEEITKLAKEQGATYVMIGGALWLMKPLIEALTEKGLKPLFAYSERDVVEKQQPDGSVEKITLFRHRGFVAAC